MSAADPVERATRLFLMIMGREALRRHPQRITNPVPGFDDLQRSDQLMLMNAMKHAVKAAKAVEQSESVPA